MYVCSTDIQLHVSRIIAMCIYYVVGSCKENKVLNTFFKKLVSILPIREISSELISAEIITIGDSDEIDIIARQSEKASYVLKKIARSINAGITRSFYQLLKVMEDYGGDVATLASDIKRALNKSSGDISV